MIPFFRSFKLRYGFLNSFGLGHIWANLTYFDFLDSPHLLIVFVDSSRLCNVNALNILIESCANYNVKFILLPHLAVKCILRFLKLICPYIPFLCYVDIFNAHHYPANIPLGSRYRFYSSNEDFPFIYKQTYSARVHHLHSFFDEFHINKDKYALVFCRDSQFWGKSSLSDLRNSSIENLLPSINYLINCGFSVIRVGRSDIPRLSIVDHPLYSDLSWSRIDSHLFEDLLFAQSSLIISSNSGITQYQRLESTPMLLLNWIPFGLRPFFKNTLYLCKHLHLSGVEIHPSLLPQSLLLSEDSQAYQNSFYSLRQNTATIILDSVVSTIDLINDDLLSSYILNSVLPFPIIYGGSAALSPPYVQHLSTL